MQSYWEKQIYNSLNYRSCQIVSCQTGSASVATFKGILTQALAFFKVSNYHIFICRQSGKKKMMCQTVSSPSAF